MQANSAVASPQTTTGAGILEEINREVSELYNKIDPVAQKFLFEIPVRPGERQMTPFVLVLGNHSAGKSTFVNYLLGKEIQATGVAPTDDGFTVLMKGSHEDQRDGQALIGTPEYGFAELSRFGPGLMKHMRLKTVSDAPILDNLMLIDSPGMIDSHESAKRSYEFEGVVQWLAEKADVVLLIFDPDKPGTTGETLKVLTSSLRGLEHKMLIVLNKVDMFTNVHDFARAYGTLCWNLAKVVHSKDLPLIFNTYVPTSHRQGIENAIPLEPFDRAREDVIRQVRRAPERRVDNAVSKLHAQSRYLMVHAKICDLVRSQIFSMNAKYFVYGLAYVGIAILLVYAAVTIGAGAVPLEWAGSIAVVFLLIGIFCLVYLRPWLIRRTRQQALSNLGNFFETLNRESLQIADQGDLRDLWSTVEGRTRRAIDTMGTSLPRLKSVEEGKLKDIIENRVPALRSRIHAHISQNKAN
jgi:GTPase Era involved in 16S rRNA processing